MAGQHLGSYSLIVRDKKILLMHRQGGHRVWEFPGGGIKFGESPEKAAEREANEETGLEVQSTGLVLIGSNVASNKHYVHFVYGCNILNGKERVADEDHDKLGWFSLNEMEKLPDLELSVREILPQIRKWLVR